MLWKCTSLRSLPSDLLKLSTQEVTVDDYRCQKQREYSNYESFTTRKGVDSIPSWRVPFRLIALASLPNRANPPPAFRNQRKPSKNLVWILPTRNNVLREPWARWERKKIVRELKPSSGTVQSSKLRVSARVFGGRWRFQGWHSNYIELQPVLVAKNSPAFMRGNVTLCERKR